jgi:hypothetical protein
MKLQRNRIIREYYSKAIVGLIFSGLLILASLYQLEIIAIWILRGREIFEFPFFLWTTSVWMARDIWYAVLVIGWILGMLSGFKLGEVKEFQSLLDSPEDAAILNEIIQIYKEESRKIRELNTEIENLLEINIDPSRQV